MYPNNLDFKYFKKFIEINDYSLFQELLTEQENQLDMLDIYHRYQNTKIIKGNKLVMQKNREVVEKVIMLG